MKMLSICKFKKELFSVDAEKILELDISSLEKETTLKNKTGKLIFDDGEKEVVVLYLSGK